MDLNKLAKPFLKDIQPYRPGKPIEQLQRERGTSGTIAKLASNENPYPPVAEVQQAIIAALQSVNRYPESGAPELTGRLATTHDVSADEVFVAHGSNEILDLLVRAYVKDDENIVFSQLSFVIYRLIAQQNGVQWKGVPPADYTHDLKAMADAIDDKTKFVFICNPNNPTSTYNSRDEIVTFLERVPDHTLVLLDEAYFEFVNAKDYPDGIELWRHHENLIVTRTFSKFQALAGLRVGYAIADLRVVSILHKLRQPFNVNRLAQAAAIAALDSAASLAPFIDETRRERERMRGTLLDLDCTVPSSQTNFLFVVPNHYDGDVCRQLEDRGIIVRPMAPFGAPANAFRVNTGTPEENDRFITAVREILGGDA